MHSLFSWGQVLLIFPQQPPQLHPMSTPSLKPSHTSCHSFCCYHASTRSPRLTCLSGSTRWTQSSPSSHGSPLSSTSLCIAALTATLLLFALPADAPPYAPTPASQSKTCFTTSSRYKTCACFALPPILRSGKEMTTGKEAI